MFHRILTKKSAIKLPCNVNRVHRDNDISCNINTLFGLSFDKNGMSDSRDYEPKAGEPCH